MVEIKEYYQNTWNRSLSDDIKEHYDEDLKSILLCLIKGTIKNLLIFNQIAAR